MEGLDLRLAEPVSSLRHEITALRHDACERDAELRRELRHLQEALRNDTDARYFELLKWFVVFWIAQAGTTAVIVTALATLTR